MAQPSDEIKKEAIELIEGLLQEHDLGAITLPPDYVTSMRRLVVPWEGGDDVA